MYVKYMIYCIILAILKYVSFCCTIRHASLVSVGFGMCLCTPGHAAEGTDWVL